jgi:hypothetical protein
MAGLAQADHLVPLGRTGWSLWREAALRSAGFPADRFTEICDEELAVAADQLDDAVPGDRERYVKVFAAATDRLTQAIRRTAAEPAFREAVTWQNPGLVGDCLDKAAAGEPRNVRGRYHELTIATYLQRYCLKNDTVGFFGPVGWAAIGPEDSGVAVRPGPHLLARRTTYFETWTIDTLAAVIAARPDVWPWLRPAVEPSAVIAGSVLRLPFRRPVPLPPIDLRVLGQCDGRHTVRDIAGDPPDPAAIAALLRLRESGAIRTDLHGPSGPWPERRLAERIAAIGDATVRAGAQAPLDELVAARDAVSAAAGNPARLEAACRGLADSFERLTGTAATRRPGRAYAGRTLVYEDTLRAGDVHIGRLGTDRLAAPLGLLLDSAVWLANTVADRFEQLARQVLERERKRTGNEQMPLLALLAAIVPEIGALDAGNPQSEIVEGVVAEFQQRWRSVLDRPDGFGTTRHHRVSAEAIAGAVAREFATGAPRWSGAHWYSPDVMLTATDAGALADGDVEFVLGELHCACNTLESQFFATQHPAPDRLRDAALATGLDRRVIIVPRHDSPLATARMTRAIELMLPIYTYLGIGAESLVPPPGAAVLPAVDLVVRRDGDDLVVTRRRGGVRHPLLEVIGEPITALTANAFRPFAAVPHVPRVSIDGLVVGRETWHLPTSEATWASVKDEPMRYLAARRWRARLGLPERAFFRVPVERKPLAVDFRSLPMVNLLAKSIRRSAPGTVTVTEMLPDVDGLWLRDAHGARYTAELRMVAVAERHAQRHA